MIPEVQNAPSSDGNAHQVTQSSQKSSWGGRCVKYITEDYGLVAGVILTVSGVNLLAMSSGLIQKDKYTPVFSELTAVAGVIGFFSGGVSILSGLYCTYRHFKELSEINSQINDIRRKIDQERRS